MKLHIDDIKQFVQQIINKEITFSDCATWENEKLLIGYAITAQWGSEQGCTLFKSELMKRLDKKETPITREEIERRGFADNTPIGRSEVDDRGLSDDYPFFYYKQPEWIDNAECFLPITPINSDLEHEISTEKPGQFVICTTFMLTGITIGIRLKRTDGNGFILYSARHHTLGNKTFNDTANGICKKMHADIRAGIALPYDGYKEGA